MDIDAILDPTRELLPEFTGSSTAGPSGQEPQIERPDNRLFKGPLRREKPDPFEVHGMKNLQELPNLDGDEVEESVAAKIRRGSLITIDGRAAVVSEVRFDPASRKMTVQANADGDPVKLTATVLSN